MTPFEISQILIGIGVIIFTYFLYQATYRLNETTKVLAEHTKRLVEHEKEQKRFQDIQRCIHLAETIRVMISSELKSLSINPFDELLTLGKYFHDSYTKNDFGHIVYRLQTAPKYNGLRSTDENLIDLLRKIEGKLLQEIIEWQKELGNYSGK